ncbi:MAG: hypothetical protein ABGW74_07955 [Campylobacterales bacterium]
MSIKEAKIIIDEYDLTTDETTYEIALEAINRFGSAKNVLIEGLKPEYKFLKKLSKLLAILGEEKTSNDDEAEKIATLMHSIYKVVLKDSISRGEDFLELMKKINVRKSFEVSEKQLWVMQYLGGREFIAKINYEDANLLNRKINDALKRYNQLIESSSNLQITN